jgi:hypothetical protein
MPLSAPTYHNAPLCGATPCSGNMEMTPSPGLFDSTETRAPRREVKKRFCTTLSRETRGFVLRRLSYAYGVRNSSRLQTGSFGVCNRDKQKFVVGTVDGRSRPIVSKQAHRGDKAGRLIRSPVLVVQRLFATGAVGEWILARRRDTDFFQHNRPCVDFVEQAV